MIFMTFEFGVSTSDLILISALYAGYGKGVILCGFLALFSLVKISELLSKFFLRSIGILKEVL